eukprot:3832862-Ditylum_brightwellii.AAC.1
MDAYVEDKPSTNTLGHLNRVWLYLGLTTSADLCNDDGVFLEHWVLTGYKRKQPKSPYPNKGKPSKISWQKWHQSPQKHFVTEISKNTRLDKNWPLDRALGWWTTADPIIH